MDTVFPKDEIITEHELDTIIRYQMPLRQWFQRLQVIMRIFETRASVNPYRGYSDKRYHYQRRLLFRKQPNYVANMGNQGGKTLTAAIEDTALATFARKNIWIVGAELGLAKHAFDYCRDIILYLEDVGFIEKPRIVDRDGLIVLKNGSKIMCKSMLRPPSLEGGQADLIDLEELSDERTNLDWIEHMMPSRLITRGGSVISAFTPIHNPAVREWTIKMSSDKDFMSLFNVSMYDFPHQDRARIEKMRETMPEQYFLERVMGQYQNYSGLCYSEFDKDRHVFEDVSNFPEDCVFFAGADFGETALNAFIMIAYSKSEQTYYVIDEVCMQTNKMEEFYNAIVEKLQSWKFDPETFPIFGDDDAITAMQELREKGLYSLIPANKKLYRDHWKESIRRVNSLFRWNAINIAMHCGEVLRELKYYSWNKKTGKPIDTYNDAMDAMRYAIFGYLIIVAKRSVEDIFQIKEYYTRKVNPSRSVKEYRERDYSNQAAPVQTYKPAYSSGAVVSKYSRNSNIRDLRRR